MFHVEHTPVQITPPLFGSPSDQSMGARLKTDDSAIANQLTDGYALPVDPCFPASPLSAKPQANLALILMTKFGKHR